jgi:hypothetical protein
MVQYSNFDSMMEAENHLKNRAKERERIQKNGESLDRRRRMIKIGKVISFFVVVFLFFGSVDAQTSSQKDLLRSFFQRSDVASLIQEMGHPTPAHEGIGVRSISDNSVYIYADYSSFWVGDYRCHYRLDIDRYGKFTNFSSTQCNCSGIASCFEAMDFSRIINYMNENGEALSSDHPAIRIQEDMRGKRLDRFTAREVLCAFLFAIWYDNGYYWRY